MEPKEMTTPEHVLSEVGDLIIAMTNDGFNYGELVPLIKAYTDLLRVVSEMPLISIGGELIENEKHPSAATPECIYVPVYFGDKLVDTVKIPTSKVR